MNYVDKLVGTLGTTASSTRVSLILDSSYFVNLDNALVRNMSSGALDYVGASHLPSCARRVSTSIVVSNDSSTIPCCLLMECMLRNFVPPSTTPFVVAPLYDAYLLGKALDIYKDDVDERDRNGVPHNGTTDKPVVAWFVELLSLYRDAMDLTNSNTATYQDLVQISAFQVSCVAHGSICPCTLVCTESDDHDAITSPSLSSSSPSSSSSSTSAPMDIGGSYNYDLPGGVTFFMNVVMLRSAWVQQRANGVALRDALVAWFNLIDRAITTSGGVLNSTVQGLPVLHVDQCAGVQCNTHCANTVFLLVDNSSALGPLIAGGLLLVFNAIIYFLMLRASRKLFPATAATITADTVTNNTTTNTATTTATASTIISSRNSSRKGSRNGRTSISNKRQTSDSEITEDHHEAERRFTNDFINRHRQGSGSSGSSNSAGITSALRDLTFGGLGSSMFFPVGASIGHNADVRKHTATSNTTASQFQIVVRNLTYRPGLGKDPILHSVNCVFPSGKVSVK